MNRIKRTCLALAAMLLLTLISPLPQMEAASGEFIVTDGTLVAYNGQSTTVTIPSDVYYIGDDVFDGKAFITNVIFHDNVVAIGRRAFQDCTGLTAVTIPPRVTAISTAAFNGCTSLRSVTLHPYLVTIGAEAFYDCPITSLTLPYSLRTVGISAFKNHQLGSIHIPSVVTAIGDFAFDGAAETTIYGTSGSYANIYANAFKNPFIVKADIHTEEPPKLPVLNLKPKAIYRDKDSELPRYTGPGKAPSSWAVQGVNYVYQNTGIEEQYFGDYNKGVSRAEAAYHLVHVYYAITNEPFVLYDNETGAAFADTENPYVITARQLGLMNGTNAGLNLFSPDTILQRQQMTMMLMNLLDKTKLAYDKSDVSHIRFSDQSAIEGWALETLQRSYHLGLINGTNTANPPAVSPANNLDREQLYLMFGNLLVSLNKIQNMYTRGGPVGTPKLLYSGVGKHPEGHIDEAYFSSPAVVDIDKDGKTEIIYTAYSIYCVDAKTGQIKWQVPAGYDRKAAPGTKPLGRSFSDIIVEDVDGDGSLEIITGHSVHYDDKGNQLLQTQYTGVLAVYDMNGYFKPGWPKRLPRIINSVASGDMDGNGTSEIVVGLVGDTSLELLWAFDAKGNVLNGWPQLNQSTSANTNPNRADNTGYLYGIQNNTIAIGDIDGSGKLSVVVPTDLRHISAYHMNGSLIKANPIFGGRSWGRVGTWADYAFEKLVENEGFSFGNSIWSSEVGGMVKIPWEDVPLEKRIYGNFLSSKALIADVDGNGVNEVVVVGTMMDTAFPYPELPLFEAPFIFNGDRTRFQTDAYDWTDVPTDAKSILSNDYRQVILSQITPIVADTNADGMNDILWNSMSGRVMSYSLDKQIAWSYWVNDKDDFTIETPSPLALADLNKDGFQEIVFATNTPYASTRTGRLIILDHKGAKQAELELPPSIGATDYTNGVISRPVIADIDGDGKPYIILNTYLSGLTVYKMP